MPNRGFHRGLAKILQVSPYLVLILGFWAPLMSWVFRFGKVTLSASFSDLQLRSTVWIAFVTAILSIMCAYPIAFVAWNSSSKWSTRISVAMTLPMMVGLLARNYSWIGLFSAAAHFPSRMVRWIGGLAYSRPGVFVVMIYIFIPIGFFILKHALESIRFESIDAARTLGSTEGEIIRKVIFPQTIRQALIGGFFIFVSALGYFVTPRMIGGGKEDMTGNVIWYFSNSLGDFETASQLAILFLLCCIPLYLVAYFVIIRSRRTVIGR